MKINKMLAELMNLGDEDCHVEKIEFEDRDIVVFTFPSGLRDTILNDLLKLLDYEEYCIESQVVDKIALKVFLRGID